MATGEFAIPTAYTLGPIVPNPFNPTTTIEFGLPTAGHILLVIHDVSGRQVATLANSPHQAGTFTRNWDGRNDAGRDVSSGVYFARMVAGDFTATKKMVLLR